jgi:hypothetical protein
MRKPTVRLESWQGCAGICLRVSNIDQQVRGANEKLGFVPLKFWSPELPCFGEPLSNDERNRGV